jgi:hypothetical protein
MIFNYFIIIIIIIVIIIIIIIIIRNFLIRFYYFFMLKILYFVFPLTINLYNFDFKCFNYFKLMIIRKLLLFIDHQKHF